MNRSVGSASSLGSTDREWTCTSCTYRNHDYASNSTCSICGNSHVREPSVKSSSTTTSFFDLNSLECIDTSSSSRAGSFVKRQAPRMMSAMDKRPSRSSMLEDVAEEISPLKPFQRPSPRLRQSGRCVRPQQHNGDIVGQLRRRENRRALQAVERHERDTTTGRATTPGAIRNSPSHAGPTTYEMEHAETEEDEHSQLDALRALERQVSYKSRSSRRSDESVSWDGAQCHDSNNTPQDSYSPLSRQLSRSGRNQGSSRTLEELQALEHEVTHPPPLSRNRTSPQSSLGGGLRRLDYQAGASIERNNSQRSVYSRFTLSSHDSSQASSSGNRGSRSNDEGWECKVCTFLNTNSLHLACSVCGHARNHGSSSSSDAPDGIMSSASSSSSSENDQQHQELPHSVQEDHVMFLERQRALQEESDKELVRKARMRELILMQQDRMNELKGGSFCADESSLISEDSLPRSPRRGYY